MLRKQRESLASLLDDDWEQVFIDDCVGAGVAVANRSLARHRDRVRGEYVMILDDDVFLRCRRFVSVLREHTRLRPPWVMVRGRIPRTPRELFPWPFGDEWRPVCGTVDTMNLVVSREVWREFIPAFGADRCGDHAFALAMWNAGIRPLWVDVLACEAMRVSSGRPE